MPNTPKYGRGQVIEIINSVISKVDHGRDDTKEVFKHIAELAEIIDSLKKDIASTNPEHVKNSHIPDATDELSAVVTATAEATNKIMGLCEDIEEITETVEGPQKDELNAKVTQIYEACTFQDITGQRIKNVIGTLQLIEQKIDSILSTLGDKVGLKVSDSKFEKIVSIEDDKSLMNGPQNAKEKAITQDDIDKLLAEFDEK